MKTYLVLFNSDFATRDKVTEFLNGDPAVYNWKAHLPNSVFFSTNLSANEMAKKLEAQFGVDSPKKFIVAQVSNVDKQGRLAPSLWKMINEPNTPPSGSD